MRKRTSLLSSCRVLLPCLSSGCRRVCAGAGGGRRPSLARRSADCARVRYSRPSALELELEWVAKERIPIKLPWPGDRSQRVVRTSKLGSKSTFNRYPAGVLLHPTPNGYLRHTQARELRDDAMDRWDQCDDACVLCLERNAARRGTAKAVGAQFCVCVQHQNVSVEDCAKSETRVGWGPAIADRDRADCAVILSYRSASALSPFVSFIIQGAAPCVAPALLLLLFPPPSPLAADCCC